MGFIFKPNTRKGPVALSTEEGPPPTITLKDGRVITAERADRHGGVYHGDEGYQWVFDNDVLGQEGAVLTFNGKQQTLDNSNLSYRGDSVGSLSESSKGAIGSPEGYTGDPRFNPGNINGQGSYPAYLGNEFPKPTFSKYDPIKSAPYQFTDPIKFGEAFGQFNRGEVTKNYNLAKDLSLDTLGTELKALEGYVPAAAALKRQQTSIDNQFNQAERTNQIDTTLPGVRSDLESQAGRARDLASGRLPSSVEDRAYEVAGRSAAADRVSAGGFGAQSSVARKTSDLMSAEQRLNLSKYGDQLLSSNITQKANLELAPTEYSDAGNQIKVNPTVSPAELISKNSQELNNRTIIDPNTGLQTVVNQNQFVTGQEQQTRQFNASNTLQNNMFNTGTKNQFALNKFGYDVQYAGSVAGAQQTAFNTQLALDQQAMYQKIFQDSLKQAQDAGTIKSIVEGIGQIGAAIKGVSSLFSSGTNSSSSPTFDLGASDSNTTVGDNGQVNVGTSQPNIDISSPNPIPDFGVEYNPGPSLGADTSLGEPPSSGTSLESGNLTPGARARLQASTQSATPPSKAAAEFNQMLGDSSNVLSPESRQALSTAGKVLASSGISSTPGPGKVNIGSDTKGNPVYSDAKLASSQDLNAGRQYVKSATDIISPLGVLSTEDKSKLNTVGSVASNVSLIANLTNAAQRGDKKGFVNAVLAAYGKPAIDKVTSGISDPKTKANAQEGLNLAASAYLLASQWGNMSGAQRSLGLANLGLSAYKTATGENLSQVKLVEDASIPGGKLTLGQGLGLFQAGYNTYALVKHWNDLSALGKVALGSADAAQIAALAKSFNLLGSGAAGAATAANAGTSATSLLTAGPSGIGSTSAAASQGTGIVEGLGDVAGVASIALGAQQVYKGWGVGGVQGRKNGVLGGLAIDAGLVALEATNPYLLAGVMAVSVLGDSIKVGKSGDQMARDGVRKAIQTNGLVDKDFNVTLADGSKANVGIDGHGGYHDAADPSKLVLAKGQGGKGGKLQAFDIDYTNDLDFASGMAGTSLSRLLTGGQAKNIDQFGGQLGNAALSNVGYGKDFSKANFDKVMANQRAMYSQAGIKSKADAYALTQQALKEGRIDSTAAVAMQQSFNMMYDPNGYDTAKKVMAGRMRGVEVAANDADKPNPKILANQKNKPEIVGGPSKPVKGNIRGIEPKKPTGGISSNNATTGTVIAESGPQMLAKKPQDFRTYKGPMQTRPANSNTNFFGTGANL